MMRRWPTACASRRARRRARSRGSWSRIAGNAASGSPVVRTKSVAPLRILPLERKVEIGARTVAQRRAADVADAPDDLRRAVAQPDALAHRVLAGEEACGERIAHDHDRRAVEVSRASNSRPSRSGICERSEVAARRRLPAHLRRPLPRGDRMFGPHERRRPVVAGQRRHRGGAGGLRRRRCASIASKRARRARCRAGCSA